MLDGGKTTNRPVFKRLVLIHGEDHPLSYPPHGRGYSWDNETISCGCVP